MHCEPVHPPDHLPASSNPDRPVYKVIFWRRDPLEGYPPERWPWAAEEWAVYDADGVHEVLAWTAHEAAEDQTYTIHIASIPDQVRDRIYCGSRGWTRRSLPDQRLHARG